MLAAKNGHKDVVFILTEKGANLNLVDKVSVHIDMLSKLSIIIMHMLKCIIYVYHYGFVKF